LISYIWSSLGELEWSLVHTHVLVVPCFGEVITIVDEALSSVDHNLVTTEQVGWPVELFGLKGHAWAMGEDWSFSQLLLFQKHWEWETAGVLGIDLLNLDSSIRQEVVEDVVLVTTVIGSVFPEDVEAENLSIVVKETLESLVWSSSLKEHLDVVLHLSLVWRSLLVIDHQPGLGEKILWVALRWVKSSSLVGVESSGEIIAVDDSENSSVHIEVHSNVKVLPDVVLGWILWSWELVSLHEDSLWNSGVLNSWLDNVDGIVIKIVVDSAFSDSVVLIGIFNNWLLEITGETKYLLQVKFKGKFQIFNQNFGDQVDQRSQQFK
jgi:hypothetical protein